MKPRSALLNWCSKQWEKPAVRAAMAVLAGAFLSSLCEFAPLAFRKPCIAAAKLVHLVTGI